MQNGSRIIQMNEITRKQDNQIRTSDSDLRIIERDDKSDENFELEC